MIRDALQWPSVRRSDDALLLGTYGSWAPDAAKGRRRYYIPKRGGDYDTAFLYEVLLLFARVQAHRGELAGLSSERFMSIDAVQLCNMKNDTRIKARVLTELGSKVVRAVHRLLYMLDFVSLSIGLRQRQQVKLLVRTFSLLTSTALYCTSSSCPEMLPLLSNTFSDSSLLRGRTGETPT